MMCALLQEPQLLILDEPTVGVDPLLREKQTIYLFKDLLDSINIIIQDLGSFNKNCFNQWYNNNNNNALY